MIKLSNHNGIINNTVVHNYAIPDKSICKMKILLFMLNTSLAFLQTFQTKSNDIYEINLKKNI